MPQIHRFLGSTELSQLNQLEEKLSKLLRYCYENGIIEKGFSTTEPWKDFVSHTKTVNDLLHNAVEKYQQLQNNEQM